MKSLEELKKYLLSNLKTKEDKIEYSQEKFWVLNKENWTLPDLFIRQWLNNGSNGFGLVRVKQVYQKLCENKDLLIELKVVNKDGYNNSGFELWKDYNFVR